TAYKKAMAKRKAAYFKTHTGARQRAAFVKAQRAELKRLRTRAACTVPASGSPSTTTDPGLPGAPTPTKPSTPPTAPITTSTTAAATTTTPSGCAPSYPDFCIPPPPPDLDCKDVAPHTNFRVLWNVPDPDPHHFDSDHDGIGCES